MEILVRAHGTQDRIPANWPALRATERCALAGRAKAAANKLSSFNNDRHDTQWKERASVNSDGNRYRVSRLDGLRRRIRLKHRRHRQVAGPQTSNPIEQVFAEFKTLLRNGSAKLRSPFQARAHILTQYPPIECAPYIRNAGYAQTQEPKILVKIDCAIGSNSALPACVQIRRIRRRNINFTGVQPSILPRLQSSAARE